MSFFIAANAADYQVNMFQLLMSVLFEKLIKIVNVLVKYLFQCNHKSHEHHCLFLTLFCISFKGRPTKVREKSPSDSRTQKYLCMWECQQLLWVNTDEHWAGKREDSVNALKEVENAQDWPVCISSQGNIYTPEIISANHINCRHFKTNCVGIWP